MSKGSMGNYNNLEVEFIERTIKLIGQYTNMIQNLDFVEQLNYTLTINCLLGLIVMPKERVITFIPKEPLSEENRHKMGLVNSSIDASINNLQELIKNLRHSIAHFDIEVISTCQNNLIDFIEFKGRDNQPAVIARFSAPEIYPFLQYYAHELSENLRKHYVKNS
jgi:HEPN pEK499 p136